MLGQASSSGVRSAHPYTRRLLAAVPIPDPRRRNHAIELDESEVPSPFRLLADPPTVAPLVPVGPDTSGLAAWNIVDWELT